MSKRREEENDDPLGDLRERIAKLEAHVQWIREELGRIDNRSWWILGSVVVLGIIAILIAVFKR